MSRDGKCGRVLIVDDLAIHRHGLERLLRWDGWEVATAADGNAALALVKQQRPDVVITDLEMPGMNGIQLLGALHAHDARLPVIVMTASASTTAMAEAMLAGAECCLDKPLDLDWLAAALARALRRGGAPANANLAASTAAPLREPVEHG